MALQITSATICMSQGGIKRSSAASATAAKASLRRGRDSRPLQVASVSVADAPGAPTSAKVKPGSLLEQVASQSQLLHDTMHSTFSKGEFGPEAATVSSRVLLNTINSSSRDVGALEGAMVYDQCDVDLTGNEDAHLDCVIDKAFVNLGAMFADRVDGRVSVEVNMTLANNKKALVRKVKFLKSMFDEIGVPTERLLFKIPATWAGIQAVKKLEADGIPCHVVLVFCPEQGAAAAAAGASLIQTYVGRVRAWYRCHPEVDNPYGDAGTSLVKSIAHYIQTNDLKSKVMAASMRGMSDVTALRGCDYLLVNDSVLDSLNALPARDALVPDMLEGYEQAASEAAEAPKDQAAFEAALQAGPAAELMVQGLQTYVAAYGSMKRYFETQVPPPNT